MWVPNILVDTEKKIHRDACIHVFMISMIFCRHIDIKHSNIKPSKYCRIISVIQTIPNIYPFLNVWIEM